MNKGNIIILLSMILAFGITSCITESSKEGTAMPKAGKKSNNSSLLSMYHKDPVNQAQMDENAIIDYAIDKDLKPLRLPSGVYYLVEEEGTGVPLVHGQPFKAHYAGYFLDGQKFDSSYDRGTPIASTVGRMIPGWNEALKMFKTGTKVKLLIPSRMAYGASGFPGFVPPNTPLMFDMHILPITGK